MRKRNFLKAVAMTLAMALLVSGTAFAATPGQALDGKEVKYGTVSSADARVLRTMFDAKYYAEQHPDVVEALGNNETALFNHFLKYGLFEGRAMSKDFNVSAYKSSYGDLVKAFKDDIISYYLHYAKYGKAEKRELVTVEKAEAAGVVVQSVVPGVTKTVPTPAQEAAKAAAKSDSSSPSSTTTTPSESTTDPVDDTSTNDPVDDTSTNDPADDTSTNDPVDDTSTNDPGDDTSTSFTLTPVLITSHPNDTETEVVANSGRCELNTSTEGVWAISGPLASMTESESSNPSQGSGKWIGLLIDTNIPGLDGLSFGGTPLTEADYQEAATFSQATGTNDYIILYLKANVVKETPRTLTFTKAGYDTATITVTFTDTSN